MCTTRCQARVPAVQVQSQRPGEKGVWTTMFTDDGETYYLNRVQNRTEWDVPEDEKHLLLKDQGPMRPYDNILFMPLKEFSEHPLSFDLLHNGQTMQVRHHCLRCCVLVIVHHT